MDILGLKSSVLKRIDECSAEVSDIAQRYNIEDFLKDATSELLRSLPINAIPTISEIPTQNIHANIDGSGYIDLPNDFLRLVEFKMKDWQRSVFQPVVYGGRDYNRQCNPNFRGGIAKPVVAIVPTTNTNKRLEYYSVVEKTHTVEKATYLKNSDPTEVPSILIDALSWLTASLILSVTGEVNLSTMARNRYAQIISLL